MLQFSPAHCYKGDMEISNDEALGWAIVLWTAALAIKTWVVMLFIGAIHGDILTAVHPIGFWASVPITLLLVVILNFRPPRIVRP